MHLVGFTIENVTMRGPINVKSVITLIMVEGKWSKQYNDESRPRIRNSAKCRCRRIWISVSTLHLCITHQLHRNKWHYLNKTLECWQRRKILLPHWKAAAVQNTVLSGSRTAPSISNLILKISNGVLLQIRSPECLKNAQYYETHNWFSQLLEINAWMYG